MSEQNMANVILALGANLKLRGNGPKTTLQQALDTLPGRGVSIRAVSRYYETPCFPAGAGPDYVNAAALVETDLSPDELLVVLHQVEHQFERARAQRWGMRTLDLDLVAWGDRVLPDRAVYDHWLHLAPEAQRHEAPEQLILPHPRLQDRAFVLVPMADVAPDWRHPVLDLSVSQMISRLPTTEVSLVKPL